MRLTWETIVLRHRGSERGPLPADSFPAPHALRTDFKLLYLWVSRQRRKATAHYPGRQHKDRSRTRERKELEPDGIFEHLCLLLSFIPKALGIYSDPVLRARGWGRGWGYMRNMKRRSQDLRRSIHKGGDSVTHEQGCRTDSQRGKSYATGAGRGPG